MDYISNLNVYICIKLRPDRKSERNLLKTFMKRPPLVESGLKGGVHSQY